MLWHSSVKRNFKPRCGIRGLNTSSAPSISLSRSYLYVPSSSERMLQKSLTTNSDMIIYDLEDSVPPSAADKNAARTRLSDFLGRDGLPPRDRVAVRVNDISTPFFSDDILKIVKSKSVGSLVLPKVHSAEDLHYVSSEIHAASRALGGSLETSGTSLGLIASIESARASWNLGTIAAWKSEFGQLGGTLTALLFAAEDYCADTSILRSSSRLELLYTRSQIVIAAKAFGLNAVDMVCVNYKDADYLKDECQDGRRLGFTGKQAIHPSQVDIIQSEFVPTATGAFAHLPKRYDIHHLPEIERAAKIVHRMELEHALNRGATGLDGEMIDKPMILQAEKILRIAKAANLKIPRLD